MSAKIFPSLFRNTEREFRSAVTFKNKENGMIYVIPGKVSNIFDAGNEILSLVGLNQKKVIEEGNYCYVEGGTLFTAKNEIAEKPKNILQNTCELQPYGEIESEPVKCQITSFLEIIRAQTSYF